jgi:two-component system chemotaxis response regulator CheB
MLQNGLISIFIVDSHRDDLLAMNEALSNFPQIKVIGKATKWSDTLARIGMIIPDIIVIEYELPDLNLKQAILQLRSISPGIEVVLVSEKHRTTSETSLEALEMGAMFFIRKPIDAEKGERVQYYQKYFRPVINLYAVNKNTRTVKASTQKNRAVPLSRPPAAKTLRSSILNDFSLLAVGSSLGGPEALKNFIPLLPADFPLPVVMVQHMPAGFTTSLANTLDEKSPLIIREARGGDKLRSGYIYLAPGGRHLTIRHDSLNKTSGEYVCVLADSPPLHGCRPSVDILFNSLAENYDGNIIAVILTGMGEDGRDGVRAMKEKGNCYCITQDEATSVVYGMPAAVVQAGLSDLSLPLQAIAARVNEMARRKSTIPAQPPAGI